MPLHSPAPDSGASLEQLLALAAPRVEEPSLYLSLDDWLAALPDPQGRAVRALYGDLRPLLLEAPGSQAAHQAWRGSPDRVGGYWGHIGECCNLAAALYATLHQRRALPFPLSDLLVVLLLHDLEKPARYASDKALEALDATHGRLTSLARGEKADRHAYRTAVIEAYGIALSPEQANALRFVEGEFPYVPGARQQGPMAALAHAVDVLSARLWFEHPAPDDPWPGAQEAQVPATKPLPPGTLRVHAGFLATLRRGMTTFRRVREGR